MEKLNTHKMPCMTNTDIYQVMHAEDPDVPPEELDATNMEVVGGFSGPIRHYGEVEVSTGSGDHTIFPNARETRFVIIKDQDGGLLVEPYDRERHRTEWERIDKMDCTPSEFEKMVEGFGDRLIPNGQLVRNARKKGASQMRWPIDDHPKPRKPKKKVD